MTKPAKHSIGEAEDERAFQAIEDYIAKYNLERMREILKPPPSWDTWDEFRKYYETVSSLVDEKDKNDALGTTTQPVPRGGV